MSSFGGYATATEYKIGRFRDQAVLRGRLSGIETLAKT